MACRGVQLLEPQKRRRRSGGWTAALRHVAEHRHCDHVAARCVHRKVGAEKRPATGGRESANGRAARAANVVILTNRAFETICVTDAGETFIANDMTYIPSTCSKHFIAMVAAGVPVHTEDVGVVAAA